MNPLLSFKLSYILILFTSFLLIIAHSSETESHGQSTQQSNNLPICSANKHVDGRWVISDKEISFKCCTAGRSHIDDPGLCGTNSWATKDPMYGAYYHGESGYFAPLHNAACSCYNYEQLAGTSPETSAFAKTDPKYVWEPRDCILPSFNGKEFCKYLGKRSILMIGDSTMQQTASSLISMIHATQGECGEQIHMGTSYMFAYNHKGVNPWHTYFDIVKPDICIINFGAWMGDEGDIYSIWEMIKRDLDTRQSTHNTTFIWKTLNAAHHDCTNRLAPESVLNTNLPGTKYNWERWPRFDEISKSYAVNRSMKVIDMSPLYYRPDYHVGRMLQSRYSSYIHNASLFDPAKLSKLDCLHYCVPGPLNIFGQILQGMFTTGEI